MQDLSTSLMLLCSEFNHFSKDCWFSGLLFFVIFHVFIYIYIYIIFLKNTTKIFLKKKKNKIRNIIFSHKTYADMHDKVENKYHSYHSKDKKRSKIIHV